MPVVYIVNGRRLDPDGNPVDKESAAVIGFDHFTVADLRAFADTNGVDLTDATKKAEIIARLTAAGLSPDA